MAKELYGEGATWWGDDMVREIHQSNVPFNWCMSCSSIPISAVSFLLELLQLVVSGLHSVLHHCIKRSRQQHSSLVLTRFCPVFSDFRLLFPELSGRILCLSLFPLGISSFWADVGFVLACFFTGRGITPRREKEVLVALGKLGKNCCTRPVETPHPWVGGIFHGWRPHPWNSAHTRRSCYSSRGGTSMGRVRNPRVGWVKSMGRGDWGLSIEEDEINTDIYLLMLWLISKWKIHGRGRPDP